MLNSQRFAIYSHLWPSSFLSCSPVRTFHSRTLLSFCAYPPLQEASMVPSKETLTSLIWALFLRFECVKITVVYASPPVSGGGVEPPHAKLATFRKIRLPVSLELHELLATVNIP